MPKKNAALVFSENGKLPADMLLVISEIELKLATAISPARRSSCNITSTGNLSDIVLSPQAIEDIRKWDRQSDD